MGVEFKTGVEVGKDITIADLKKQGYEAFYVAIGAQGGRKLGVPGEDAEGVISGVDFLRKVNLGKGRETPWQSHRHGRWQRRDRRREHRGSLWRFER
jgi:NADPH-dependent glutamate synthase beta subunit-like oxidoreductase